MSQTFILTCLDKPAALDLRLATRQEHLNYVAGFVADGFEILIAGPILNDKGDLAGSHFIINAKSEADIRKFNENDPYTKAGLFSDITIRRYKILIGALAPK